MKLTQLTEQKERPYICVHAKKGKHETHATSSYDAAKNAAEHWGMKSTAGIDAHLADVEHVAEEVITEGPCDIATKDDISKMNADEYAKYAQWKKDCEAEERTTPLSTKRLESFDDYHGDMSQEEYDQEVDNSQMEYAVWVGGTEVNDKWLTYDEAIALYDKYKAQGYDDIKLDARIKESVSPGDEYADSEGMVSNCCGAPMMDYNDGHGRCSDCKEMAAGETDEEFYESYSNDGKTVTISDYQPEGEANSHKKFNLRKQIHRGEDGKLIKSPYGGYKVSFHGNAEDVKAYAEKSLGEASKKQKPFYDKPLKEEVQSGPKAEVGMKMKRMLGDEITIGTITKVSPEGVDVKFEDGKTVTYNDGYYDWSNDKEVPFITYESAKPDFLDLDKDGDKKEPMKKAVKDKKRTDEIFPLALGGMAGALMADRKAKRDAEQLNADEGDDSEEAVAARDEFLKVMDMKPKSSNKAIDTIKKIVADKQNQQVKFDDGKMKVDLYTASAVSQVYDAVKPETQEKIDNMLRTKEGMLKMSNFAFSKLKEGLKEGKQLDEILPVVGMALGAIGRGIAKVAGSAAAKSVGKAAVKTAIKNPIKTTQAIKALKPNKQEPVAEENLDEISPYTGADGIKDKNGKMHGPNSPRGKMIKNMTKKVVAPKTTAGVKPSVKPAQSTVKPAGVGRGNGAGSKATQIKPGAGVKPPAGKSALQKGGNLVGKAAKGAVGLVKKIGNPIAKGAASSGFGNPLSASKQYADDMVEKAKRDAEEIEEISIRPAPKFKISGPHGQKPGSHHPPAKSVPRFKASVKF